MNKLHPKYAERRATVETTVFIVTLMLPFLIMFGWLGCAGLMPGSDPVVVDAEKATSIAVETFNTFLKLEYDNQGLIKENAPAIHAYANYVRAHAPQWIASARALTASYKDNRTAENKASLETALAVLTQAITQIAQYTQQINQLH